MLPILFRIGPFNLQTISLFQAIAFFACALVFWRRAKEESYLEAKVFDGLLLSFIVGWLVGRVGYIVFSWSKFGFDVLKWLNIVHFPGINIFLALIGATLYLYFYAKKQKWDAFEVLDWWAQALTMGLIWMYVGQFFSGIGFGHTTSLPWGVVFPGVFEPRHPTQLYYALMGIVLYRLLHWLEFNYRSFEWYRAGKKTAQTGFLLISFIIGYSLFSWIIGFIQPPQLLIGEVFLDSIIYFASLIFGIYLLLFRSNRVLFSFKQKRFFAIKQ